MTGRTASAPAAAAVPIVAALLLAACAARGAAPAAPSARAPAASLPEFEVKISRFANLVHFVDNLAGTSQGKTIRAYRRYWADRVGFPDGRDRELLGTWTALRYKNVPRRPATILNERGCLPWSEPDPGWRHRFLVRSYDAESIDAFVDSMEGDLEPEEMSRLREVLEAFEPPFDEIWKEMTFLPRFKESFEAYLRDSGLRPFLGEMARFFGVDPSAFPPGRIHLMALPADSGTHAQANGRDLLMEIRPNDTPIEQIQVISHETAHYLWHLVAPDRNDALARQAHEASPRGAVIWRRLRESLPTALGQGLAEARLAPQRFGLQHRWYHIDAEDRFAKAIYPVVERAFREGRRIDDGIMAELARAADASTALRHAAAADYLNDVLFAVGDGMIGPYTELRSNLPMETAWTFGLADAEAAGFLDRYACLTGVVLLSPSDAARAGDLPPALAPPAGGSDGDAADGLAGARSSIRTARRPGGGLNIYLTAAREEDIPRIATAFLKLADLPSSPVLLPPADPAAR